MTGAAPALGYKPRREVLNETGPWLKQPMSAEVQQEPVAPLLNRAPDKAAMFKSKNKFLHVRWRDCLQHTQ